MAKTEAKQGQPSRRAATRAFERAWKLLGRLEKRLAAARNEEAKRRRQLAAAIGDDVARRQAQLDEAASNVARVAGLLTELSEMIAANARAQAGRTVSDFAHAAADAVRDEARARTAAGPPLPRPRRPATTTPAAAKPSATRQVAPKPPAAPRPRPRRSLQSGTPDPDQSSS